MPNLFICLTPLQALIAQALIRQTAQPADLLMVCYPEADNAKFQHYYQQTAAQCRRSRYHIVPRRPWQRAFALPRLLDGLDSHYHTLYAASIDNANVQYPANRLTFDRLETFDDGTGNLYPQSLLYQNDNPKRRLLNALRGIRCTTRCTPTCPTSPRPPAPCNCGKGSLKSSPAPPQPPPFTSCSGSRSTPKPRATPP